MKTITTISAGLVLAAGPTAGGLASSAQAKTVPTPKYCTSSLFQQCASIKIIGVSIDTPPGYYPTPAGPIIQVTSSAKFSKAGVQVTDFRLLVDGRLVPESNTYFGSGSVGVLYGANRASISTDEGESIPGTAFPVAAGRQSLVTEVIGVNGAVLAKSAAYTVTVPEQAAAVRPKLTYTASTYYTWPMSDSSSEVITQSGNTVTITSASGLVSLGGSNYYSGLEFSCDTTTTAPPALVLGSVTFDGIPVS